MFEKITSDYETEVKFNKFKAGDIVKADIEGKSLLTLSVVHNDHNGLIMRDAFNPYDVYSMSLVAPRALYYGNKEYTLKRAYIQSSSTEVVELSQHKGLFGYDTNSREIVQTYTPLAVGDKVEIFVDNFLWDEAEVVAVNQLGFVIQKGMEFAVIDHTMETNLKDRIIMVSNVRYDD